MERDELRAVQTPLKARYREAPGAAVVTLRAEGELDEEAVACSVQTGRALVEAGLHPSTGGDVSLACSGDMLLQALVACAGVTMRSVAVNRQIPITAGRIVAEGDLDFRGTLGVDREAFSGLPRDSAVLRAGVSRPAGGHREPDHSDGALLGRAPDSGRRSRCQRDRDRQLGQPVHPRARRRARGSCSSGLVEVVCGGGLWAGGAAACAVFVLLIAAAPAAVAAPAPDPTCDFPA